jgi:hypothetical protein
MQGPKKQSARTGFDASAVYFAEPDSLAMAGDAALLSGAHYRAAAGVRASGPAPAAGRVARSKSGTAG